MIARSADLLQSFSEFCVEHPEQRFWQALRNWSSEDYIMAWKADEFNFDKAAEMGLVDTFFREGRTV